jgi:hypothetical protein
MEVNIMKRKFVAILILACFMINIMSIKTDAVVPAIPVAVYYAVAGAFTAAGLYCVSDDSMSAAVSNYWAGLSKDIRYRWEVVARAGPMIGKMMVDVPLNATIINWLNENHQTGAHTKTDGEVVTSENLEDLTPGRNVKQIDKWAFVYIIESGTNYVRLGIKNTETGQAYYQATSTRLGLASIAGMGLCAVYYSAQNNYALMCWCSYYIDGKLKLLTFNPCDGSMLWLGTGAQTVVSPKEYTYVGDSAGFGAALAPDQDVKIPCPPVPAPEWPDRWIDDLEKDLNNTTADQYVESMDNEFDWYVDKDGNIYKKPKGDPPKKEDDTKLVPPVPPPYQPIHPQPGEPGPATPDQPFIPAEPCPYCPETPGPGPSCPNPYCPNHPQPVTPPQFDPSTPADPCPYCPPSPDPNSNPCPNPYCPNNPEPQNPPAIPDQSPTPDDRYIDFEPLKKAGAIFVWKFPFSLPWDLLRIIQSISSTGEIPKFQLVLPGIGGDDVMVEVELPEQFEYLIPAIRTVFLICYMLALLWGTRKLMGGDV